MWWWFLAAFAVGGLVWWWVSHGFPEDSEWVDDELEAVRRIT